MAGARQNFTQRVALSLDARLDIGIAEYLKRRLKIETFSVVVNWMLSSTNQAFETQTIVYWCAIFCAYRSLGQCCDLVDFGNLLQGSVITRNWQLWIKPLLAIPNSWTSWTLRAMLRCLCTILRITSTFYWVRLYWALIKSSTALPNIEWFPTPQPWLFLVFARCGRPAVARPRVHRGAPVV